MKPILTWLVLPVVLAQGLAVRRKAGRLAPPEGPREGVAGAGTPAIRLLVLGDSSAAGVGAETHDQSLAPQLAGILSERTGQAVHWRIAGFSSATSGEIRDHVVKHLPRDAYTHIVLSIGTNDAKNFHTLSRFKRDFGGLAYALVARFPSARILWSPVVEMRDVPALPAFLARVLSVRANAVNALGARLSRERGISAAPPLPVGSPLGFASDGFHAGPLGYRAWAEHLAPLLLDR